MTEEPIIPQYEPRPGEPAERYPIVIPAAKCQTRLKTDGDWVVFPKTIERVAREGLPDVVKN